MVVTENTFDSHDCIRARNGSENTGGSEAIRMEIYGMSIHKEVTVYLRNTAPVKSVAESGSDITIKIVEKTGTNSLPDADGTKIV